ncbi:hypothetical protein ZIOFF_021195 [Zingiber officinale]|uniref:Uncharacterized protein n=1 Tax=Zingiber officinale TaxID=94328 RepID=A0A8J5GZX2_ZINOF|nr:hypothetical protein ZIOFF_021195 [Zingiber officinale]
MTSSSHPAGGRRTVFLGVDVGTGGSRAVNDGSFHLDVRPFLGERSHLIGQKYMWFMIFSKCTNYCLRRKSHTLPDSTVSEGFFYRSPAKSWKNDQIMNHAFSRLQLSHLDISDPEKSNDNKSLSCRALISLIDEGGKQVYLWQPFSP